MKCNVLLTTYLQSIFFLYTCRSHCSHSCSILLHIKYSSMPTFLRNRCVLLSWNPIGSLLMVFWPFCTKILVWNSFVSNVLYPWQSVIEYRVSNYRTENQSELKKKKKKDYTFHQNVWCGAVKWALSHRSTKLHCGPSHITLLIQVELKGTVNGRCVLLFFGLFVFLLFVEQPESLLTLHQSLVDQVLPHVYNHSSNYWSLVSRCCPAPQLCWNEQRSKQGQSSILGCTDRWLNWTVLMWRLPR